jgi:hypothetical protein
VLVVIDLVVLPPEIDLFALRQITALLGLFFLLYGSIWDAG